MIYLTLIICFFTSLLITPLVRKLALYIGATDKPNHRKIHVEAMPRLGGIAIFVSFLLGIAILQPQDQDMKALLIGAFIIVIVGVVDDMVNLKASVKFLGQTAAALVVVLNGIQVDYINLPFGGGIELGLMSIPLTLLWIIGITNAINLIDGLDGLAAGVSTIALITISAMAFIKGDIAVLSIGIILIGSTLGFLKHNFYPAKIFMGDTGALFLGYMIAVMSLMGLFKNVTALSLIVPVIILGVPISDTFFAIIRRLVNKQPLTAPDKSHLHHCMLNLGFTHKQTVWLIYAMAASFGLMAFIFSMSTVWGALILVAVILFIIEVIVEKVGLIGKEYKPLLRFMSEKKPMNHDKQ
ncbi:MAG: glycosyltransferase family 4 protein [Bacillus sp. (in: firmicutes)]